MTVGYNKLLIIKIYIISIGTVNNDVMSFYKTCISAFKNTDYQVIMSVGKLVPFDDFDDLPDNISVFSRVDKISVLGAVNETLNDSSYKKNAIKISGGFKKSSGAKGAAGKIIQVCNDAM